VTYDVEEKGEYGKSEASEEEKESKVTKFTPSLSVRPSMMHLHTSKGEDLDPWSFTLFFVCESSGAREWV